MILLWFNLFVFWGFFADMYWGYLIFICFIHLVNYSAVNADGSKYDDTGCMYYATHFFFLRKTLLNDKPVQSWVFGKLRVIHCNNRTIQMKDPKTADFKPEMSIALGILKKTNWNISTTYEDFYENRKTGY